MTFSEPIFLGGDEGAIETQLQRFLLSSRGIPDDEISYCRLFVLSYGEVR